MYVHGVRLLRKLCIVVWKNTRDDWLDSCGVPEWDELVMTEKYTYAVFYNNDMAAADESIIRVPRMPDIPFGLGVALFEVWLDCLTIDVNKGLKNIFTRKRLNY